jgi:transglutaminase-like putative cysteine protease
MLEYLEPTPTINHDHVEVMNFTNQHTHGLVDPRTKATRLFYAVRDTILYDPYSYKLSVEGLRASTTLRIGRAWCVPKAILLAACCRAAGIPARLGFADVRNHLSTTRMRKNMKDDVFFWHGYTSIYLDETWLRATPAFNIELCQRFRLMPLEFDGRNDALFQPFDLEGNRHMEYIRYRGEFADVPIDRIAMTFGREYFAGSDWQNADFDREVDQEMSEDS